MSIAVLAAVLIFFEPKVFGLPYPGKNYISEKFKDEQKEPLKKKLYPERFSRETSESTVAATTTTLQVPTPPDEEDATADVQGSDMCGDKTRTSQCKTLQEAIEQYIDASFGIPIEASYNAFLLVDLYLSGLLKNSKLSDLGQNERTRDLGRTACNRFINEYYKPKNISSGDCLWYYTCVRDPNYFPSFRVEAKLVNPSLFDRGVCNEERMRVKALKREACKGDPCRTWNWSIYPIDITVGYTHR